MHPVKIYGFPAHADTPIVAR